MERPRPPDSPVDLLRLVRDANAGARAAQRELIERVLAPLVQARVGRVLLRRGAGRRNLREELRDLSQEVLVHLFTSGALADWDPLRGPLSAYIGRIAENRSLSLLRGRTTNPWGQVPIEGDEIERRLGAESGEADARVASRSDLLRLARALSDAEWELFLLFFVEERTAEEVAAVTGKSVEAVRKQRQRLRAQAESILGATRDEPRAKEAV